MSPSEYRAIRERIGNQEHVARLLDVTSVTIRNRESGRGRITVEAAHALRHVAMLERRRPTPQVQRLSQKAHRTERADSTRRRAAKFEREYCSKERVVFVSSLPCAVPGCKVTGPRDNAHAVGGGASRKAEFTTILPLCRNHHRDQHWLGSRTFEKRYGINLMDEARKTQALWSENYI